MNTIIKIELTNKDDVIALIKLLSSRTFDRIEFRKNGKIIEKYNGWVLYAYGMDNKMTIKHIRKMYKKHNQDEKLYVRFIREKY